MNSRALAALILFQVLEEGQSLSQALPKQLAKVSKLRDPQLVQAICYGVLRHYYSLEKNLSVLLTKPLKNKEKTLHYLLLVGLYQLEYLSVPQHIVLNETVNAAKQLTRDWAASLTNGVLRQYLRQRENLPAATKAEKEAYYNHPLWLIEKLEQAWPEDYETILAANQIHPPFSLRINTSAISREDYQHLLQEKEMESELPPLSETALTLKKAVAVEDLPLFREGKVSVQDSASQLAAVLLDCPSKARVLDACAAPGGKTGHILERYSDLSELVSVEIDSERVKKIADNLARLKLKATLKVADIMQPNSWWDGKQFDRILCDAPCSATGVIRRHPDIKFLREPEDFALLAQEQLKILLTLWPLLKTEGKLVYSTCSIFPEENEAVIEQFLQLEKTAEIEKITLAGLTSKQGLQILTGQQGMDGFYYAVLRKKA